MNGASVVTVVGELEPAGMPQHVGMHEEGEFRNHAGLARARSPSAAGSVKTT